MAQEEMCLHTHSCTQIYEAKFGEIAQTYINFLETYSNRNPDPVSKRRHDFHPQLHQSSIINWSEMCPWKKPPPITHRCTQSLSVQQKENDEWWAVTESINILLVLIAIRPHSTTTMTHTHTQFCVVTVSLWGHCTVLTFIHCVQLNPNPY